MKSSLRKGKFVAVVCVLCLLISGCQSPSIRATPTPPPTDDFNADVQIIIQNWYNKTDYVYAHISLSNSTGVTFFNDTDKVFYGSSYSAIVSSNRFTKDSRISFYFNITNASGGLVVEEGPYKWRPGECGTLRLNMLLYPNGSVKRMKDCEL